MSSNKIKKGFTLVEMLVGAAVFAVIALSVFHGYASFMQLVGAGKFKIMATDVANSEFELIRNMPYSSVGLVGGIPSGILLATTTAVRDNYTFQITRTIRNTDEPYDGQIGGSPNDLSPADYKMVQIEVACASCKNFQPMSIVGRVAPKNLETASTNGALFIKVFDANGVPVQGASVSLTKSTTPTVSINDVTDASGLLAIVDAPPGVNAYRISATKSGYTTDRTYATSSGNPNPTKPDATVIIQQVTQISFVIDKVSTINISSKNMQCLPIASVPFLLTGGKLIGTDPDVLKFTGNYSTDSSGIKTLNNIEWDTFNLSITGGGFNLAGVNPPSPFAVLPDAVQNIDIVLAEGEPNNLLVTVKDSATSLPLSEVELTLTQGSFSADKVTGRGYLEQTDWSGGAGQSNFADESRYWSDDGNIDTSSPAGELKLIKNLGHYVFSGILTSSIFDTGTSSNFSNIVWSPTDQPPQSGSDSVKLQFATALENTAETVWTYLGSDGTAGTFYTTSNNNINAVHSGDRYFRYKIFLSTLVDNKTPNVASVAATYTSDCIPPGQALFSALSSGNHDLLLEKSGYQTQTFPVNIITNDDWQSIEASILPE